MKKTSLPDGPRFISIPQIFVQLDGTNISDLIVQPYPFVVYSLNTWNWNNNNNNNNDYEE